MKKSYSQRQKRIESRGDRIFSGVNAAILILLCIVTLYPIWVCPVRFLYIQYVPGVPSGDDTLAA